MQNNNGPKQHTRMSYMDGEMSASQRAEFEKKMTSEQKEKIRLDKAIQVHLADSIQCMDQCPENLWGRVLSEINSPTHPHRTRRIIPFSAIAACILLCFSFIYVNHALSKPVEYQVSLSEDIASFAESASIKGDQKTIEGMLNESGFDVSIADIDTCNRQHRHHIDLLGMNMLQIGNQKYTCAHLHFSCCRQPVSTYIVKNSRRITPDSFKIEDLPGEVHKISHHANGYLIVTISHHPTSTVGSLFEDSSQGNQNAQ